MHIVIDGIIELLQSQGGISVYFENLISRYSSDLSNQVTYYNYLDKSKIISKQREIPCMGFTVKNFLPRKFERYRKCSVNDGDLFHSTYYRVPDTNIPSVTTVYDFIYERLITGPKKWVHSHQKRMAVNQSDLIICISENTAIDLIDYFKTDESKIRVIHCGVSEKFFPIDTIASYTNRVLFVGSRAGYKNFSHAVKAVASNSELELVIIGGGALKRHELTMLDCYLPNRYRCVGTLTEEELNLEYNRAFCLFYPSSYEGFGVPVIEAMRAGCPVVAVNSSSIPEVAGNAGILVDFPDVDLFSEALSALDVGEERDKQIKEGFSQALNFSWQKCYKKTLSVYQELY
jgi:mannosyltransferase